MNETNSKKIEYFIALCDDLITCKFLVAESKIQKLLAALADTPPIYELVSECMEQFNRDREMNKAFLADAKGRFFCIMPTEEYKIIALVFCTLADIDQKKIDFTDFIKRFFDDEDGVNCYTSFARRMILPFRELIAEAFGLPKRYTFEQAPVEAEEEHEESDDDDAEEETPSDIFETVVNISRDMLVEIEHNEKKKDEVLEFRLVVSQLLKAAQNHDLPCVLALGLAAKCLSKPVKSVKFLMKELNETLEEKLEDFLDEDDD